MSNKNFYKIPELKGILSSNCLQTTVSQLSIDFSDSYRLSWNHSIAKFSKILHLCNTYALLSENIVICLVGGEEKFYGFSQCYQSIFQAILG